MKNFLKKIEINKTNDYRKYIFKYGTPNEIEDFIRITYNCHQPINIFNGTNEKFIQKHIDTILKCNLTFSMKYSYFIKYFSFSRKIYGSSIIVEYDEHYHYFINIITLCSLIRWTNIVFYNQINEEFLNKNKIIIKIVNMLLIIYLIILIMINI